jgi:hypothetical protein
MKKLCVFGCLLTEEGKKIKTEMLSWLKEYYNVLCIDQQPPGQLFEYPAIKYTIKLALEFNVPVLYTHTKGAANPTGQENLQSKIRKIWKHEFTKNIDSYFGNYEGVRTPFTGSLKKTWFNSFVLYPNAAKELQKTFHLDSNRFYYEGLFNNTNINVYGVVRNDLNMNRYGSSIPILNAIREISVDE